MVRQLEASDLSVSGDKVLIKGVTKPGMLLTWAAFCSHCTRFKSTYAQLHSRIGNDFEILAVEDKKLPRDAAYAMSIQGYPTLKFVDQSGKVTEEYNEPRDIDSLLAHICKFYHKCASV